MLKYLLTTLLTATISVTTTLTAVDFQRERLVYSLSEPTQLGDLTHQKLRIANRGWSAAINVKIYLAHGSQGAADLQATLEASPPFDLATPGPVALGGYERLRKHETAVVDLTFKGPPLQAKEISIKSDESIAALEGTMEAQTLVTNVIGTLIPERGSQGMLKTNGSF